MRRVVRVALLAVGGVVVVAAGLAVAGSLRTTPVVTVSRTTTACPAAVWDLWADVPGRVRWDDGLEWIRADGPFVTGTTGEVKLEGQPPRRFTLLDVTPQTAYTDRFHLPAGSHMDWQHTITPEAGTPEAGDRHRVTFAVGVRGPGPLPTALIARSVLERELPATVDRLIANAEAEPTDRCSS